MSLHVHAFTHGATPAQMEDADERRSCDCGQREPREGRVHVVMAIDPGSTQSAWIVLKDGVPRRFGIEANEDVLRLLGRAHESVHAVVIETIESYGMAVGRDVFETVWWAGRFYEAAQPLPVHRLPRRDVKLYLCQSSRAKDANVRQALLDRFGGGKAKGTKAAPGPLYGVSKDVWAALAVAVTWADREAT